MKANRPPRVSYSFVVGEDGKKWYVTNEKALGTWLTRAEVALLLSIANPRLVITTARADGPVSCSPGTSSR